MTVLCGRGVWLGIGVGGGKRGVDSAVEAIVGSREYLYLVQSFGEALKRQCITFQSFHKMSSKIVGTCGTSTRALVLDTHCQA